MNIVGPLLPVQAPLNDDTGNICASVLLNHLLKVAHLSRLEVRGTQGGTLASIQYILRLPSGTEYVYTGWPDFQVHQRFSQEERRLTSPLGEEERVRAIGEVQSPPGTSHTVKNCAFAQAGHLYTRLQC